MKFIKLGRWRGEKSVRYEFHIWRWCLDLGLCERHWEPADDK